MKVPIQRAVNNNFFFQLALFFAKYLTLLSHCSSKVALPEGSVGDQITAAELKPTNEGWSVVWHRVRHRET